MYARVNRFKSQPDEVDKSIAWWGEHIAAMRPPGRQGSVLFVDRGTGEGVSIGLWTSLEALTQDEPANIQVRTEAQNATQLELLPVERYEVSARVGAEKPTGAARLTWTEGAPERLDDGIQWWRENTGQWWQTQPGGEGALLLVDRATGKAISMTLWESDEAMRASETGGGQLSSSGSQALDRRVVSVGRYEVAGWVEYSAVAH